MPHAAKQRSQRGSKAGPLHIVGVSYLYLLYVTRHAPPHPHPPPVALRARRLPPDISHWSVHDTVAAPRTSLRSHIIKLRMPPVAVKTPKRSRLPLTCRVYNPKPTKRLQPSTSFLIVCIDFNTVYIRVVTILLLYHNVLYGWWITEWCIYQIKLL